MIYTFITPSLIGQLKGGQCPRALSKEEEQQLTTYILYMAKNGLPIGRKDVRYLATEMEKLHSVSIFGCDGASDGWLSSFLRRHPEISLRRPSHVDGGRFAMARQSVIDRYFEMMKDIFNKYQIHNQPSRILNLDETGFNREPK